ncbi:hypothetical protein POTOM_037250 [Populus tomentosa]|uniref:Uncharacterized protein n=1 Tax=Populus tomentosa TaxID=118781 RepID=A0A8X8CJW5_POPTO|nr:hypothetical protein POTOM_037248 [Populus tomentosa]KAG6756951.1 hypothetical protein POTOM_037250 [Populus tomentosa]
MERPMINLAGKDLRKSSSACRDVRIPKNINTNVDEEKREIASATIKTVEKLNQNGNGHYGRHGLVTKRASSHRFPLRGLARR